MTYILAPNINQWRSEENQEPFPVQAGILPDPATGDLYNSAVVMQDTAHIYTSYRFAPLCPPLVTLGSTVGLLANIVPDDIGLLYGDADT